MLDLGLKEVEIFCAFHHEIVRVLCRNVNVGFLHNGNYAAFWTKEASRHLLIDLRLDPLRFILERIVFRRFSLEVIRRTGLLRRFLRRCNRLTVELLSSKPIPERWHDAKTRGDQLHRLEVSHARDIRTNPSRLWLNERFTFQGRGSRALRRLNYAS